MSSGAGCTAAGRNATSSVAYAPATAAVQVRLPVAPAVGKLWVAAEMLSPAPTEAYWPLMPAGAVNPVFALTIAKLTSSTLPDVVVTPFATRLVLLAPTLPE